MIESFIGYSLNFPFAKLFSHFPKTQSCPEIAPCFAKPRRRRWGSNPWPTKECYLLMYSWEIGIERITGANRESDALRVKKGKFPPNHQEMDPVEVGRMGRGGCSSPSYLWFVSLFSLSSFPFPPFFCVAALQLLGCWLRDLKAPFHQQRKRRKTGQVTKVYSLEPQIHPDEWTPSHCADFAWRNKSPPQNEWVWICFIWWEGGSICGSGVCLWGAISW